MIIVKLSKFIKQMTEVFEVCESSFYNSLRAAQKSLRSPNLTILEISEATQSLKEAAQELNKMEIEYNISRDPSIKSKIEVFKEELRSYKRDLNKAQSKLRQQQSEQNSGPFLESDEQEKGINPLIEAKRQMHQNEGMSQEISNNLKRNNEILVKNINRMGDINNQLTVAHKLLNSIKNKLRKNKLVMWGTLGFLFLVLAIVLYSYFGGSKSTTTIVQADPAATPAGNSSN